MGPDNTTLVIAAVVSALFATLISVLFDRILLRGDGIAVRVAMGAFFWISAFLLLIAIAAVLMLLAYPPAK